MMASIISFKILSPRPKRLNGTSQASMQVEYSARNVVSGQTVMCFTYSLRNHNNNVDIERATPERTLRSDEDTLMLDLIFSKVDDESFELVVEASIENTNDSDYLPMQR